MAPQGAVSVVIPAPCLAFWLERHAALRPAQEAIVYWHRGDGSERIGAIFVPLNFRLSAPEIASTMIDCDARLLIYGDQYIDIKEAVAGQCSCGLYVLSRRDRRDEFGRVDAADVTDVADVPVMASRWDESAWLLYTSGSTGQPKGVILSHGNVFWNTTNLILIQGGFAGERVRISAPLFHAAPVATFMESFLRGACIHLERSFDAERLLRRIADERINVIAGVPAM